MTMLDAAKSGENLTILAALRDTLAARLDDETLAAYAVASLARELSKVAEAIRVETERREVAAEMERLGLL